MTTVFHLGNTFDGRLNNVVTFKEILYFLVCQELNQIRNKDFFQVSKDFIKSSFVYIGACFFNFVNK